MNLPDYPEKGESICAWLRRLFLYVRTLELRGDGKTCRIDRTAAGSVLHILPHGGGGGSVYSYNGPFRLGFDGGKLLIQNGANPSSANAGLANINGDLLPVPTGSIEPKAGYVILTAELKNNAVTFSWGISTDLPTGENGSSKGYSVAGEIIKIDDVETIIQYPHGVLTVFIGGECKQ